MKKILITVLNIAAICFSSSLLAEKTKMSDETLLATALSLGDCTVTLGVDVKVQPKSDKVKVGNVMILLNSVDNEKTRILKATTAGIIGYRKIRNLKPENPGSPTIIGEDSFPKKTIRGFNFLLSETIGDVNLGSAGDIILECVGEVPAEEEI